METSELESLISKCLGDFYQRRLQKLQSLKLKTFLRRKNPYLFRALGIQKASEIVERLLADYIGASDETIFGDAFFEPIARIVSAGTVADGAGVDFLIEDEERIRAVAVKSGPNPYNASQKRRQNDEFIAIRNRLYKMHKLFDPILAHAYGRRSRTTSYIYRESSGQAFWEEMTGDTDFYLKLMGLMKDEPTKHWQEYRPQWDAAVNRFTAEFVQTYCFIDGSIEWEKLVRYVSQTSDSKSDSKSASE